MRNQIYEQALTRFGVDWKYQEGIPIKDINLTRGKQMQARLVPLDDELIERYKRMIEAGSKPPALLLLKPTRGMYVPLDGNQRLAANERAGKNKIKYWDAYVVEIDDTMVSERLCWQFNAAVNGRQPTYQELLSHAVTMVRKYNQPVGPTADDWGVKAWELQAKVRELEIREAAAKKNIDTSKVPQSNLLQVSALGKLGEDVLLKAVNVVAKSGIDNESIRELVSQVDRAKSSSEKIAVVEEWSSSDEVKRRAAETKGGSVRHRKGRTPRERLERHLGDLESLFDAYKHEAFRGGDMKKHRSMARNVVNGLITIYGLGSLLKQEADVA